MLTHVFKISECNTHCPSLIATASLYGNEDILDFLKKEIQTTVLVKKEAPFDFGGRLGYNTFIK